MEVTWGACEPSQPGVLSGRASGLGLAALCHHLVVAVRSLQPKYSWVRTGLGDTGTYPHSGFALGLCACPCVASLIITFLTQKVGIVGHGFLSRAGRSAGPGGLPRGRLPWSRLFRNPV